uniref:Uncharacterized protein n=1 Tax=Panagrolaimus sp. ES5 TaxID=591445 RepID=A0AC34GTW7_9BILA
KMSMKCGKDCIVTLCFSGFSHAVLLSIFYPNNHRGQEFLEIADFYKDPSKCSEFFTQLTALIPAQYIKGLVLNARVKVPFNVIQKVNNNFRKWCESNDIFFYVPSTSLVGDYAMLSTIKPKIENNECVAIVAGLEKIAFEIFKRTGRTFEFLEILHVPPSNLAAFKKTYMEKYNIKHLLFVKLTEDNKLMAQITDNTQKVIKAFPGVPVGFNDKTYNDLLTDSEAELIRYAMGEKNGSQYLIKPFFDRHIEIPSLIECKVGQLLPFEKSVIQKVKNDKYITLREPKFGELECIAFPQIKTDEVEITLKVDSNMFYEIKVKPVLGNTSKKSETLESNFEKIIVLKDAAAATLKAKIVFTPKYFSIYLMDYRKEEKVIKDSAGCTEIPLYISFLEKKPVVGEAALKIMEENPTFVVYDLMKLCSTNFDKADPKWPFKISKDSNDATFIELETFEGFRVSEPDFLMAIIFKSCLKMIKKEIGETMEEVEIEFKDVGSKDEYVATFTEAAEKVNLKLKFV